ncbi:MAG: Crp/Fnr family transcriptional regulator [Parafannyhessea sp.]|uniref:Crp/Fnr family transcriptional regulator n=1 Tax=Parafannyhessea sp. TaxID=2847324 RepID=UPI003F0E0F8A
MDIRKRYEHCIDTLAAGPLFRGIPRDDIPRMLVLMRGRCHTFQRDDVIQPFGEPFRLVGIPMSGEVEGSFDSERYDHVSVRRFTVGDIFGAAFACAEVDSSPIELVALCKSEVVLLDVRPLWEAEDPSGEVVTLLGNLLRIVSTQSVFLNRKVRILGQRSLRDRLVVYLRELPANADGWVRVPMSQTALAQFIGANRSAMSRELGRMEDDGVLERDGNRMRLSDDVWRP